MTDPYRSMVPITAPEKKRTGLIPAPPYQKPHRCDPPILNRFLRGICFWLPKINHHSLWRCGCCKEIYKAIWKESAPEHKRESWWYRGLEWYMYSNCGDKSLLELWKEAGGAE
jgi:hypothetical protein